MKTNETEWKIKKKQAIMEKSWRIGISEKQHSNKKMRIGEEQMRKNKVEGFIMNKIDVQANISEACKIREGLESKGIIAKVQFWEQRRQEYFLRPVTKTL